MSGSTAYVLTGGGAKGCFQIGAMQCLKNAGIKPSAIYGTSVGALNSFGYKWMGLDTLTDVWLGIKSKKEILKFNWNTLLLKSDGIFNLSPLEKKMRKYSSEKPENNIESIVTRVSLRSGDIEYCSSRYYNYNDFINCVVSSSSIPGIMSPIDGEWVDGGVREMAPIGKAIANGHKSIIVIETSPRIIPTFNPSNFIANTYRAIDGLLEHEVFLGDLSFCEMKHPKVSIMSIYPNEVVCDTLQFNHEKIKSGIAKGFAAATKLLEKGSM